MKPKKEFKKAKEILQLLEGLTYSECKRTLEGVNNRLEYAKQRVKFIYEEPRVL